MEKDSIHQHYSLSLLCYWVCFLHNFCLGFKEYIVDFYRILQVSSVTADCRKLE